MRAIDEIGRLLAEHGARAYGGEPVSQLEHALQCASLAEAEGAPESLVVAALLHDLGHLLYADGVRPAERGIDGRHEALAADRLLGWYGPEVVEPVSLHVAAKRYLCATEPAYFGGLSAGSVRSLELQGGSFGETEASDFAARPFAAEAIRLRRWDDRAKVPGLVTLPLERFLEAAKRQLRVA